MHHVFISYARVNEEQMRLVVARLEVAAVPVWTDTTDLPPSVRWERELEKAILASALVVVCETSEWRASAPCQQELAVAVEVGKRIVRISAESGFDPTAAADVVIAAYRDYREEERALTELEVRAEEWLSRERRRSLLAPRQALRTLKSAQYGSSDGAHQYYRTSRRRNRWRRVIGVAGASLTLVSFGLMYFVSKVLGPAGDLVRQDTTEWVEFAAGSDLTHWNVYAGAERAADRINDQSSYAHMRDLMAALDAEVPDRAGLVAGRSIAGLVPGAAGDVRVVSTSGSVGDQAGGGTAVVGLAADEAITAVGASAEGRHTVFATAGRSFFEDGLVGSCGGRVAAAGSGGTRAVADARRICVWAPGAASPVEIARTDTTALTVTGTSVVAGAVDGSVLSYPASGGAPTELVSADGRAVTALAVSPAGDQVAVAKADTAVITVRDAVTGAVFRDVLVGQSPSALAFAPGARVLAAAVGSRVDVVDLTAGAVQQVLAGNTAAPITAVVWSADGDRVWAATAEQRVLRWTWRHGTVLFDDPRVWVTNQTGLPGGGAVALTRDGDVLRVAGDRGVVRETTAAGPQVASLAASPDGSTVSVASGNQVVLHRLGAAADADTVWTVPDCSPQNTAFAASGAELYLACGQDGVAMMELSTGRIVKTLPLGAGGALSLAIARDGTLFVGGYRGDVQRVSADLSGSDVVAAAGSTSCATPRRALAASVDGTVVVAVGDGGASFGCVLHAAWNGSSWVTGVIPLPGEPARQARAIAFSPDDSLVAIGFGNGSIATFALSDQSPRWIWRELTGAVRGLSFTADGSSIIASTRDGLVETIPSCPGCSSPTLMAQLARDRVEQAIAMGLYTR